MLKRKRNNKICANDLCFVQPCFNFPAETKGLYCTEHKLETMINVTKIRCAHINCSVQPLFNLKTESKGLFCGEHKLENMINVVSKRCAYENCNVHPFFNYLGEKKKDYFVPTTNPKT